MNEPTQTEEEPYFMCKAYGQHGRCRKPVFENSLCALHQRLYLEGKEIKLEKETIRIKEKEPEFKPDLPNIEALEHYRRTGCYGPPNALFWEGIGKRKIHK